MEAEKKIKVAFISNYFTHHQKSLSDGLNSRCNYSFVETTQMTEERKNMGWSIKDAPSYVYSLTEAPKQAMEKIAQADIVIVGNAPSGLVRDCLRRNQIVLRYNERPLKNGIEPIKFVPRFIRWHSQNPFWKRIYLLCASAYTAKDYARFGLFHRKAYRWGYFPEVKQYEDIVNVLQKKEKGSLLWAGRFLDWKHPDAAIRLAAKLKAEGIPFSLKMIGSGPMEQNLRQLIVSEGLENCVELLGTMSPEQVRFHMEKANIFLFTSDYKEGWGAVLNEAMNSGCCVVACEAAGSVPYLIKHGHNGLSYPYGNEDALYAQVQMALKSEEKMKQFGKKAYEDMVNLWNGETAAERLITLLQRILAGERFPDVYLEGPGSKESVH